MNLDEFEAQAKADELQDATHLTPIEYGRLRGMKPQMVYYYIRRGVIDIERCQCGRKVVNVAAADEALSPDEKARRREVAARDTGPAFAVVDEGPVVRPMSQGHSVEGDEREVLQTQRGDD